MMRSRPHPDDPSQSYLDKWTLQLNPDPALGGGSEHKQTMHAASGKQQPVEGRVPRDCFGHEAILSGEKSMTETIDQDISLLARVQAGARSSGFDRAWLSDQEIRVAHFHDALNETYREAGLLAD
tara:strand:- start:313 stop:687 length:375 start_codon:yes stop_codon:yes gene_type:complete